MTKKGEINMFKKLCSVVAVIAIFVMAISPVMAADTSAFKRELNTFDDNTSLSSLNGGTTYYVYNAEEGVDGRQGRLCVPAASDVNTGFVYGSIMDTDKKYKISMWVKKADVTEAKIYALVMLNGATVEVTAKGSSANEVGSILADKSPWTSGSTYVISDEWTKYETIIDMSSDIFTLGSSSKVKISSYSAFQIRLRGSGAYYVDNLSVEPCYDYTEVEEQTEATGNYTEGEEILNSRRTIATRYSTTIGLGQSSAQSLVSAGTDVTIDNNGRGTVKFGGKTGDMAFVAISASGERYVRFQGHNDGYGYINKLNDRTVYQVKIRMKTPEFVIDSSITDSKYHISSNGVVKVKTGTNGKIGSTMSMSISRANSAEGYIPVHFTSPTILTTDWVDYTGYVYFNPASPITWDATPMMQVTVPGNAGIFYVDEISIKPLEYDDGNLAINGDFSLTKGNKAIFYDGADYTVSSDATYGNYLTVSNEATEKTMPEMLIQAQNGDTRSISFYAKGEAASTLTAKAGGVALTPENSTLTTEWTKYEYTYTADDANENLVISSDVNFSVADVKITAPVTPVLDVFTSFDVAGTVAETHTLDISYTYPTNTQSSYFVRVSRGDETNGYLPVYESETDEPRVENYHITEADIGKKLMVEVLVIQSGEIKAVKYTTDVVAPALVISPAIVGWNQTTHKISATVDVANNRAGGDALKLFAVMVLVGENEKVLNLVESGGITVPAGEPGYIDFDMDDMVGVSAGNLQGIAPEYAKLYVWEGTSLFDTTMTPYTDEVLYTLQ